MKTADEMFQELGYHMIYKDNHKIIYQRVGGFISNKFKYQIEIDLDCTYVEMTMCSVEDESDIEVVGMGFKALLAVAKLLEELDVQL